MMRSKVRTPGDGDCAVTAVLQSKFYCDWHEHSEREHGAGNDEKVKKEASAGVGLWREKVADMLSGRKYPSLGMLASKLRSFMSTAASRETLVSMDGDAVFKDIDSMITLGYGRRFRDGGMWFDEIGLRALAAVLQRDIVVVNETGCMFVYSSESVNLHAKGKRKGSCFNSYFYEYNLPRANGDSLVFIPTVALWRKTIVILHENNNHFSATKLEFGAVPELREKDKLSEFVRIRELCKTDL